MPNLEVIDELMGLGFPEALRWRDGQLWFSDMFRGKVMSWQPGEAPKTVVSEENGGPAMPGGLGWTSGGELLVVDCLERKVIKVSLDGSLSTFVDLSHKTEHPLNDMHVDSNGTAWIGGYGFDPETQEPRKSPIFRVSSSLEMSQSEALFTFPNGCDRRGAELVVAETFSDQLTFFDDEFNIVDVVYCGPGAGPDGLAIDPHGNVYVAMAFRSTIERLGADGQFEAVYRINNSVGAIGGPKGIFDCAITQSDSVMAFSSACLDEGFSMANNTGSITLVNL